MNLNDAIERELPYLRQQAESRMTSRCKVHRKTGTSTVTDGFKVTGWTVVHGELPVRIAGTRGGVAASRTSDSAANEIQLAVREANFPSATDDLADGDLIEMTLGPLSGEVFRIVEATWKDQATARQVPIVATGRPKEWEQ